MSDQPSIAGPLAKIDRANEHIRNLDGLVRRFIDDRPYEVVSDVDPNPNTQVRRVTRVGDVPLGLRVLVGEISHHLRSSFDLLVYQLMLKAGATRTELEHCEFPVLVGCDLSTAEGMQKYESELGRKIKAIRRTRGGALIEALQPCRPGNNEAGSALAQLDYLDNTDKHRLLLALVGSTQVSGWRFDDGTGQVVTVPALSYVPLQQGAVLKWETRTLEVDVDLKLPIPLDVTFGEEGTLRNKPVIPTLQQLSDFAASTIRLFQQEFG